MSIGNVMLSDNFMFDIVMTSCNSCLRK